MIHLKDDNFDQILEDFSSEELINLSDDLLKIAIELTLHEDLDIPELDSFAKGNDLLVIIPKIIASRLNKAELYSQKFASLNHEDLIFAGYTIEELRNISKLLEDVIWLVEHHPRDDVYREVFEELKDNFDLNAQVYREALKNVNEAYRIQSRHLMNNAIRVYKHVTAYQLEHFLHESASTLENYRDQLTNAIDLLESAEIREKYDEQLRGLRKTLILILEALNTHTIGNGFSEKKISFIHEIVYHIRHTPEDYIFEVIRRFATISREKVLKGYMTPEEIAVRYRTRYIKHNRVLLSFVSNPIKVSDDFILEVINVILQNLSVALNVKLEFIRTGTVCTEVLNISSTGGPEASFPSFPYTQKELEDFYRRVSNVLTILEKYTINSDYLETLQEECYRVSIVLLRWIATDRLVEIVNIQRRYQIYAARRLFVLRISTLCMFIFAYSAEQLSKIASEKILAVSRGLIQFKYDFLKPTSIYLESMFDLDTYRTPVLKKIQVAISSIHSSSQKRQDIAEELIRIRPFFSQLVIDCLALKVQELDNTPEVLSKETSLSRDELQLRINSSRERIEYFLKQHREEHPFFLELYQRSEIEQTEKLFENNSENGTTPSIFLTDLKT